VTTEIRFFGYSAFEITNSQGVKILIDPYLDENPVSPVKVDDLDKADLILVTHGAYDHIGDTVKIAECRPLSKTISFVVIEKLSED